MTDNNRKQKIEERAYGIWEKEGRPAGRALDHWVAAERHDGRGGEQQNEGEGNKTAAREFNRDQTAFAKTGPVEQKAKEARDALDGAERGSLENAEKAGRSRSAGEDSAIRKR